MVEAEETLEPGYVMEATVSGTCGLEMRLMSVLSGTEGNARLGS